MKISLEKNELIDKLTKASKFTSTKLSSATVLQGVLLKCEKKQMHIYSTDLNRYFHTSIKIESDEKVQVIIDHKKIMEFLQLFPADKLDMEITTEQIIIKKGRTKGNFSVQTSDEFPLPPAVDKEKKQKLEVSFLTVDLKKILFSASKDDSRPVLTGVNFVSAEEEFVAVTTDGFRLSILKKERLRDIPSMIVPAEFLQEVCKGIQDEKELDFSYSEEDKLISFHLNDCDYYSRLIEGEFPPYERVIPTSYSTKVELNKGEFMKNVKLISVFARDFSNTIICEFAENQIVIKPKKEGNEENTAVIEAVIEGESQIVAFNFRYLMDFLNHFEGKNLTMEILRPKAPVVLKDEKNNSYIHIIMPVRL